MATKRYLDYRSADFALGSQVAIWARPETVKNTFPEADDWSTTDLVLTTSSLQPNVETVYHDDEQKRSGSRSKRDAIKGRRNHGSMDLEAYVRPSGTVGAVPQAATLYKAVFGSERIVDSATLRNISAVTASTRLLTTFTVPAGMYTNLAVGDGVTYKSNNTLTADNEAQIRFVKSLDGSNVVTFEPGWKVVPVTAGTADQVQGCVTYKLTNDYTTTRSLLVLQGYSSHQLRGSAIEGVTQSIDGVNPMKQTFQIGFRERVTCARDQVRGDGVGADSFLDTDVLLTVGDARFFEEGTWINLTKTVISSGVETTETAALITAVNYTTNILTLTRGTSPIAATDLMASVTSANAGAYDTTTAYNLDMKADGFGWVTLDLDNGGSHAAGRTRATIASNLNKQLAQSNVYNFNVVGGLDVFWGKLDGTGAFSDGTSGVKFQSPLWGSNSSIEFRASASNSAHTLLGFAAVETLSTNEVRIEPWNPVISSSAETGTPIHNFAGWLTWNGYRLGVTKFEVNLNNNVKWLEEEKRDDDLPAGFVCTGTRTVEVTMSGYFYGEIPALFYQSRADVIGSAVIQCGSTRGYCTAWHLKNFKVANPQVSGDEQMEYSVTLRVFATSALEDEVAAAFG